MNNPLVMQLLWLATALLGLSITVELASAKTRWGRIMAVVAFVFVLIYLAAALGWVQIT